MATGTTRPAAAAAVRDLTPGQQVLKETFPEGGNRYEIAFSSADRSENLTGYLRADQSFLDALQKPYEEKRGFLSRHLPWAKTLTVQSPLIEDGLPGIYNDPDQTAYNAAMQALAKPGCYVVASKHPSAPIALSYNTKESRYFTIHGLTGKGIANLSKDDLDALDGILATEKAAFTKALKDYKQAIVDHREKKIDSDDLEEAYSHYETIKMGFKSLLDARVNDASETEYSKQSNTFLTANNPDQLYASLAPQPTPLMDGLGGVEQSGDKAQAKWRDYQNIKNYLATEGRFSSARVKENLLFAATGDAMNAFNADRTDFTTNLQATEAYAGTLHTDARGREVLKGGFAEDLRVYHKPLSDGDFTKELLPHLLNPTVREVPEFLMKRVTPFQKKLAEAMFRSKRIGTLEADAVILINKLGTVLAKTFLTSLCVAGSPLIWAFKLIFPDNSDMGLARDLEGVFRDMTFAEASGTLEDPDASVDNTDKFDSEFLQQMLENPKTQQAATPRAAKRLEKEIKEALNHPSFTHALDEMIQAQTTLEEYTSLLDTSEGSDPVPSTHLKAEIYRKLEILARYADKYSRPDPKKHLAEFREPYSTVQSKYKDAQLMVDSELYPLYLKHSELLTKGADGFDALISDPSRADLLEEKITALKALRGSLPTYTTEKTPGKTAKQKEYANLPNIHRLKAYLNEKIALGDDMLVVFPIIKKVQDAAAAAQESANTAQGYLDRAQAAVNENGNTPATTIALANTRLATVFAKAQAGTAKANIRAAEVDIQHGRITDFNAYLEAAQAAALAAAEQCEAARLASIAASAEPEFGTPVPGTPVT